MQECQDMVIASVVTGQDLMTVLGTQYDKVYDGNNTGLPFSLSRCR